MAEKSGFFNSVNGDRKYKSDFFAEYFASFIGNGIFPNPSNALQVIADTNMNIIVKAGKAWINGHYYCNDADLFLTLDTADGLLNRIDKIVLQFNTLSRTISIKNKKGAFASTAVAPILQRDSNAYELALADIYIAKGSVNVTQSNITDIRLDSSRCGIVHGTVDQVDTTTLFNQYHTWLNEKKSTYDSDMAAWTTQKKSDYQSWYNTTIQNEQSEIDAMETQFQNDFNTWFDSVKAIINDTSIGNLNSKIDAVPKVFKGANAPTSPAAIDIWHKDLGSGNIQINERSADNTTWVEVSPKTKAGNVITNAGLDMEAQLADLQKIQTAGGIATAITLTNVKLTDGFTKTFVVSASNNAAATTVNGKNLYKANSTTAPNLTQGKAVTIWYNLASDCFFIKASAEGNATVSTVLAGKTFSNDSDTGLVGTMTNYNGLTVSTQGETTLITAVDGFGSGTGGSYGVVSHKLKASGYMTIDTIVKQNVYGLNPAVVKAGHPVGNVDLGINGTFTSDGTATASQILAGYIAYVNGAKLTGSMTNIAADQNNAGIAKSGTTIGLKVPAGYWDGTKNVNAASTSIDSNLISSNILNGVSIMGVTGNMVNRKTATGSTTSFADNSAAHRWWADVTGYNRYYAYIEVTGLSFNPTLIVACYKNSSNEYTTIYEATGNSYVSKTIKYLNTSLTSYASGTYYEMNGDTYTKAGVTGTIPCVSYGFCLPVVAGATVFQWFAIE